MLMEFKDALNCNADVLGALNGFDSVCIDSREVKQGSLFVALNGTKVDGHNFVEQAFNAGAVGAVVQKSSIQSFDLKNLAQKKNAVLIAADDTLKCLQDLAGLYLKKFPGLLRVGITGSAGKTTTKEIAVAIMANEKNVVCNAGNFNSETGLPLSVFSVRAEHEIGVFEMGMNRCGEIAELAEVLQPDIACITNVGSAHVGCIGSLEKIALEKKTIFSKFTGKQIAILPDCGNFKALLEDGIKGSVNYFGLDTFKKQGGQKKSKGLSGTEIFMEGQNVNFALPGDHNFVNALAAAAVAKSAGIQSVSIIKGLSNVKAMFGRCEIISGEAEVVLDCYNSNPQSLKEALDLCNAAQCSGRKIFVIGEMLELGSESKAEHEKAGELLNDSLCEFVFLFGTETLETKKKIKSKKCFWTNDIEELKTELNKTVQKGDLVLLKGSRGCALERAVGNWGKRGA
ncbi:MAG: UDP-N-acetylmuramoyl-tripeptide--D-alanyl-D-alanine ligase [Spirochaetaceae bacterium]|jgi:UDP-N-acetylmuramoyl-tripeptide--D-alanyl-D-alanine ligase|nr:UDP-N-acetylmuramoyl-tripeptide--D-alanyl-D-alanine ligase [Spirochaetaceae bacterium]